MTTFNVSTDLPSNINTLERLALWVTLALQKVNPTKSVVEVPNNDPEKVAQLAILRADDDSIRAICRLSIEVDSSYGENAVKFWENALELSNTDLPVAFKSN